MTDKWTIKLVAKRLEHDTLMLRDIVTDKLQKYFSEYPDINSTQTEMPPEETTSQISKLIQPEMFQDIALQLNQMLLWMCWVESSERKLIWMRATGLPWKTIARELGYDRGTAWRKWVIALTKIVSRLNVQHLQS